ncbi:MAG: DciA family protein [Candidatus Thiodiazotropha sp. LLP2]
MKSLRNIVDRSSTPAKLGRQLADYDALCKRVRSSLPPPLDQQLKATVLQAGTLSLFVSSPVWASRLRYATPQLIDQLKRQGLTVERVRTRVLPNQNTAPIRPKHKMRSLSIENSEMLRQTAEAIIDPKLSEALLKLSRHGEKSV